MATKYKIGERFIFSSYPDQGVPASYHGETCRITTYNSKSDLSVTFDCDLEDDSWWCTDENLKPIPALETVTVKSTQVGGDHYHTMGIQPFEYALANNLGALEHTAIKYVSRWKKKGGVEDLKKAVHALQFLIEYTEQHGVPGNA